MFMPLWKEGMKKVACIVLLIKVKIGQNKGILTQAETTTKKSFVTRMTKIKSSQWILICTIARMEEKRSNKQENPINTLIIIAFGLTQAIPTIG